MGVCSSCETDLTYSLWLVSGGIVRGSQAKQSDEVAVRWPPAVADRHWAAGVAVAGIESAASPLHAWSRRRRTRRRRRRVWVA